MKMVRDILDTLPEGTVEEIVIGLHWTAVVVIVDGEPRCGLAATLREDHKHSREPDVPEAGSLMHLPARELAGWVVSQKATLASLGGAALNALLPRTPQAWVNCNASEMIAELGKEKKVTLVGHFSFVDDLRARVGELHVLERNPQPGDLPAEAAGEVIPRSDVVAITGMTITNRSLEELLALCPEQASVVLLGPSTPLSPVLFRYGISVISGAVVENVDGALNTLKQGGNFHQIRAAGVRLVTMVNHRTAFCA